MENIASNCVEPLAMALLALEELPVHNLAMNDLEMDDIDISPRESDEREPEIVRPPLRKLPPGPWRSLGGYLDYTNWEERERFRELDLAVQAKALNDQLEMEALQQIPAPPPHRRCRAKVAHRANCNAMFYITQDYDGWRCVTHRTAAHSLYRAQRSAGQE